MIHDLPASGRAARSSASLLSGNAVVPRHGTESLTGVTPHDLRAHRSAHGDRPSYAGRGDVLVADLETVRLTGRGGGHFPVAAKWRSVLAAGRAGRVVVNAAEGEPGSAKDAVLLQTRPHLVLDGLVSAMEVVGATEGVVWLHAGADATARSVRHALAERAAAGLGDPPVRVLLAPDRYLSGEATGIIRTLEGGPTLPRFVRDPARPWSDGHPPVLVQNAETMARIGLVALHGAAAYRPTSLVTVVNDTHRVVAEVGPELTVGDVVVALWTSPDGAAPSAVLLGGYGGSWVSWSAARTLRLDPDALREAGLSIGAGLIGPLPASACGLEESARLVRYLADQSARQCGPCVFGLAAIADLALDLSAGRLTSAGRRRLRTFMLEVNGRGACRHPDGALRMLASALAVFSADVERHRRGRTCEARRFAVLPLPGEVVDAHR
ncbi:MAG: NADH-ubiquinone oxidoreductase-F iron-sulfur binding region domain-containing protein [Candidatus Nanopelagicales bacterium]